MAMVGDRWSPVSVCVFRCICAEFAPSSGLALIFNFNLVELCDITRYSVCAGVAAGDACEMDTGDSREQTPVLVDACGCDPKQGDMVDSDPVDNCGPVPGSDEANGAAFGDNWI